MTNIIKFPCAVAQVRTLSDGGIRLSLDLPESAIREAAMLMECRRLGIALIADLSADPSAQDAPKTLNISKDLLNELDA